MDEPVVVRYTVTIGQVVSWYRDLNAANHHDALVTASRNGVLAGRGVYLNDIVGYVLDAALLAHTKLSADPPRDLSFLATHAPPPGISNGPLSPVRR